VLILAGISLVRQTPWRDRERRDWRRSWSDTSAATAATGTIPSGGLTGDPSERFSLFSFLSGVRRASSASRFLGGDIFSFMGGTNLDLRQATILPGEEAVIEIFAVMSGTEITVPSNWMIVTPVVPVMGGIEDKRLPPLAGSLPPAGAPSAPRLVLRGFILMSGIQIKS
jgi:hypothetical protein